jgi:nucleolar protein 58
MIIQVIGLLDDLDKELNTYAMRIREWYGWHFPELTKIVADNIQYASAVKLMGSRVNAADIDFSAVSCVNITMLVFKASARSFGITGRLSFSVVAGRCGSRAKGSSCDIDGHRSYRN